MFPLQESYCASGLWGWLLAGLIYQQFETKRTILQTQYEFLMHIKGQVFSKLETVGSRWRPEREGSSKRLTTELTENPAPTLAKVTV